jgi:hypothetical protein
MTPPFRSSALRAGFACAAVLFGTVVSQAQVLFDGATTYTQNFDSLPRSGAVFTFEDNTTLAGWFSSLGYTGTPNGQVSNGSSATLAGDGTSIYSWGSKGNPDRALGAFTRMGTATTSHLALQLQNTSGGVINAITITFDVEQWRRNSKGAALAFSYLTTPSNQDFSKSDSGYVTDARGGLREFVTGENGAGVNGNNLRQSVSFVLNGLAWKNGDYLWLRWSIVDSMSKGAGIGIDNLSIAAVPSAATASVIPAAPLDRRDALLAAAAVRRHH